MAILDLAGANQGTVSFITNYGHRLYSDDFLSPTGPAASARAISMRTSPTPALSTHFLDAALDFPREAFDGALVWDVLEYLSPLAADRGGRAAARDAAAGLLPARRVPCRRARRNACHRYSFRIHDHRTIPARGPRAPPARAVLQQSQPGETVPGFPIGQILSDARPPARSYRPPLSSKANSCPLKTILFEQRIARAAQIEARGFRPYGQRFDFTHAFPQIVTSYGAARRGNWNGTSRACPSRAASRPSAGWARPASCT